MIKILSICVTGAANSPHESERAMALSRLGHNVRFVSPTPAKIHDICVFVPTGGHIKYPPLRRLVTMLSTLWNIGRIKCDVVHCHYAAEYTTWAAALLGKKPLVITVMGGDVLFDEQGTQGIISRALTRFSLRKADLITVKSPRLRQVVEKMGVNPSKIMQVLWGVDLTKFKVNPNVAKDLRAKWGVDRHNIIFLSPRPLKSFYNQLLIIDALPEICKSVPNALLVISSYAEEDGLRDILMSRANKLNINEHIRFAEPRAHCAMASLYGACDIVISIPPSDGFPQTLVEGAVIGRPCIMTNAKQFDGLIEADKHACFIDLNSNDLASQAIALAQDKNLRDRIAGNAKEFCEKHANLMKDAARVVDKMIMLAGSN